MRAFPRFHAVLAITLAVALAAAIAAALPMHATAAEVTTPLGLKMIDVKVGTGAQPKKGQTVMVDYTGWLYENGQKGAKFDSSVDRGYPFMFQLGKGEVIQGWDEGVASMKVGGKRTLIIPPILGYGNRGNGSIPPNATLMFDVELLEIKE